MSVSAGSLLEGAREHSRHLYCLLARTATPPYLSSPSTAYPPPPMSVALEEPPQAAHLLSETPSDSAPVADVAPALKEAVDALSKTEAPADDLVHEGDDDAVDATATPHDNEDVTAEPAASVQNDAIENKDAEEAADDAHVEVCLYILPLCPFVLIVAPLDDAGE